MERGGNMPCVLNAANEIAVAEFLKDRIGFLQMSDVVEQCLATMNFVSKPSLEDYVETDKGTRRVASNFIHQRRFSN
jgi:1-deoxy-D-xylulose-5-phosphate reductoisomerase